MDYNPIFNSWIVEKWLKTLYLHNVINLRVMRKILQKGS